MSISIQDCQHSYLYRISARNFSLGVYNEKSCGFIGLRYKFGDEFLFTEYHWDTGPPFGTVHPMEKLELYCGVLEDDSQELFNWLKEKEKQYV